MRRFALVSAVLVALTSLLVLGCSDQQVAPTEVPLTPDQPKRAGGTTFARLRQQALSSLESRIENAIGAELSRSIDLHLNQSVQAGWFGLMTGRHT